ncbi:MAG: MFS transporter, partial [Methanobacteriota archaeon]
SMGIAAVVFAMFIGRVQITPQNFPLFLTSVQVSFAIFAVLCFIGMLTSLARGSERKQKAESPQS